MAVHINTLNGGNITVTLGSGGSTPSNYWTVTSDTDAGTFTLHGTKTNASSEFENETGQYKASLWFNEGWNFKVEKYLDSYETWQETWFSEDPITEDAISSASLNENSTQFTVYIIEGMTWRTFTFNWV